MNFLLIAGQPSTGKTETIRRIYKLFSKEEIKSYDFSKILKITDTAGKDIKVLFHTATDNDDWIKKLKKKIDENQVDIVISSIRDIERERKMVLDIVAENFSFEIPLARITRRHSNDKRKNAIEWYKKSIDKNIKFVISQPPFNLNIN